MDEVVLMVDKIGFMSFFFSGFFRFLVFITPIHYDSLSPSFILFSLILPAGCLLHFGRDVANNLAARCVSRRGLVTFKLSWQTGGARGTNASMTYYVAEHVIVNPLRMKDNVGVCRERRRETQGLGEHMTRWRCVWTRMGFCAADNLNASNSTVPGLLQVDVICSGTHDP